MKKKRKKKRDPVLKVDRLTRVKGDPVLQDDPY